MEDQHSGDATCCVPAPKIDASKSTGSSGSGYSLLTSAGSVAAAFLASACCIGPLVFALLGLGGAGLLVAFEPYRPYFITLTFALLGAGFYFTYGRPRASTSAATVGQSAEACDCPAPRTNRAGRVMLWVATALVVAFLATPYLIPMFLA